jgi:protein ImuA
VIYAETGKTKNVLLVMEEGLKHSGLAGVVGEIDKLTLTASRRLHLAAESSGVVAFALRRWLNSAEAEKADATAANTRWRITTEGSVPLSTPGIGRALWRLELLRCRNGNPATFSVEACNAKGQLSACRITPSALLAGRPAAAEVGRRYISA